MKQPTAQQILDNKDTCKEHSTSKWVEWYNYKLKILREQSNIVLVEREKNEN